MKETDQFITTGDTYTMGITVLVVLCQLLMLLAIQMAIHYPQVSFNRVDNNMMLLGLNKVNVDQFRISYRFKESMCSLSINYSLIKDASNFAYKG